MARQVISQLDLRQLVRKQKIQNEENLKSQVKLQKAEAAARGSHQFLHSILDALSQHIVVLNQEGTILEVNEAWRRFASQSLFREANIGVGENYLDITKQTSGSLESFLAILAGFKELVQGKRDYVETEYSCHSPVETQWILLQMTRFVLDGQVRIVMVHENSTSQKHALEALRKSEERFDLAIKGTNDGIWDWMDVTQDAEWWSPQFYHLLGYESGEITASLSMFKELLHSDDQERTFQKVRNHFEKSEPF
ncbi:MAG: PAS domain-containing protein, partial [Nitrospirales bacterium]